MAEGLDEDLPTHPFDHFASEKTYATARFHAITIRKRDDAKTMLLASFLTQLRAVGTARPRYEVKRAANGQMAFFYAPQDVQAWLDEEGYVYERTPEVTPPPLAPSAERLAKLVAENTRLQEELQGLQATVHTYQHELKHAHELLDSHQLVAADVIRSQAIPIEQQCGIYFLLDGEEIVYVGQSVNILARVAGHLTGQMVFNAYAYLEFPVEELTLRESEYQSCFAPKYNRTFAARPLRHLLRQHRLPVAWEALSKAEQAILTFLQHRMRLLPQHKWAQRGAIQRLVKHGILVPNGDGYVLAPTLRPGHP